MKKAASALMALTFSVVALASNDKEAVAKTYTLDTQKSTITWLGKKVTGEHTGNLNFKSGSIVMDAGEIATATFTTDMSSITCTDLDGEYADKLLGHLKSDDFFGVATHPTAKFEMTSYESTGATTGEMTGTLTIKGIAQEITVPVTMSEKKGQLTLNGEVEFDRTKFNIKYGSGSFFDDLGDKTIYDEVNFSFSITAKG